MHPADTDKKSDVAMYLFDVPIDGRLYEGDIPAKCWEDAQAAVEKFGGHVIARSVLFIEDEKICAACSGDVPIDTKPKAVDDFPGEIE